MKKRIIKFVQVEHSNIFSVIRHAVNDYNSSGKIMSISFDNASNNVGAAELLKNELHPILDGAFFHIKCMCHIMNLCVQDGLRQIAPQIEKIRDAILYILVIVYKNLRKYVDHLVTHQEECYRM